jgi:hypothetical protein
MFTFGSVDFSQDADVVAEREAIMAEEYAREAAEEAAKSHAKISADIIQVTVAEYLKLEATARNRGECPCLTCLIGEGDLLCVDCHFKYAIAGTDLCSKCWCYDDNYFNGVSESFIERVNAIGKSVGVENAYAKFEAEERAEVEEIDIAEGEHFGWQIWGVDQWATANGRIIAI